MTWFFKIFPLDQNNSKTSTKKFIGEIWFLNNSLFVFICTVKDILTMLKAEISQNFKNFEDSQDP